MSQNVQQIPLSELLPDTVGLRTEVNKKDDKWPELVSSIRDQGVLQAILVRPNPKPTEENPQPYIIVDGFHRYEALQELIAATGTDPSTVLVPSIVRSDMTPEQIMTAQVECNIQRIETRRVQLARQFEALMAANPTLTQQGIADMIHKSQTWVQQTLQLNKLSDRAKELTNQGKITAFNAVQLAKLPEEEQEHWLDRAQTTDAATFAGNIVNRLAILRKEARGEKSDEFIPTARLMKKGDLLTAIEEAGNHPSIAEIDDADGIVDRESVDFRAGYYLGLLTAAGLDPESRAEQERAHHQTIAEREAKKAERNRASAAATAAERGLKLLDQKRAVPRGFEEEAQEDHDAEAVAAGIEEIED